MEFKTQRLKWKLALLAGRPLAMAAIFVIVTAIATQSLG